MAHVPAGFMSFITDSAQCTRDCKLNCCELIPRTLLSFCALNDLSLVGPGLRSAPYRCIDLRAVVEGLVPNQFGSHGGREWFVLLRRG